GFGARTNNAQSAELVRNRRVVIFEIVVFRTAVGSLDDAGRIFDASAVAETCDRSPGFDTGIVIPETKPVYRCAEITGTKVLRGCPTKSVGEGFSASVYSSEF